jgi:DNA modification methylase
MRFELTTPTLARLCSGWSGVGKARIKGYVNVNKNKKGTTPMAQPKANTLYYGDNLSWMRKWPDEKFDLIYLDPPFNSNADYNMIFGAGAQIRAYDDIWQWGEEAAKDFDEALQTTPKIADTVSGFQKIMPESPMLAYLSHLAPRLYHMHRLLKDTGSLYLHCDDAAGHYIKVLLDSVFSPAHYRNTIIWRRAAAHNDAVRFGRILDHIYFYTKSKKFKWNGDAIAEPKTEENLATRYDKIDDNGRRYVSDNLTGPSGSQKKGAPSTMPWEGYDVFKKGRVWSPPKCGKGKYADYIKDNWILDYDKIEGVHERLDALNAAGLIYHPPRGKWPGLKRYAEADSNIPPQNLILNPIGFTNYTAGSEYLGYDTQKPEALLKKFILASSDPDDWVLDPYCGCGTTVHVCRDVLGRGKVTPEVARNFVGIDITHVAIGVIEHRFLTRLNEDVDVVGAPEDFAAAKDLFLRSPFQFEAWAVSRFRGFMPNEVKSGDRGVDGRGHVFTQKKDGGRPLALIQVKGGKNLTPAMAREFVGTITSEGASIGMFVVMSKANVSKGVKAALSNGTIEFDGVSYPKAQIFSIEEYFEGLRPNLPPMLNPSSRRERELFEHVPKKESEMAET